MTKQGTSGFARRVAWCSPQGGFAQIYLHNNNAPGLTGDGHVLALEAGVGLRDMELVQFYPTALGNHGGRVLLYEALVFQGGAILRNANGEDILRKYGLKEPRAATRDRVSQVITQEILEGRGVGGGVVMDLGELAGAMPASLRLLLPAQLDPEPKGALRLADHPFLHGRRDCRARRRDVACRVSLWRGRSVAECTARTDLVGTRLRRSLSWAPWPEGTQPRGPRE